MSKLGQREQAAIEAVAGRSRWRGPGPDRHGSHTALVAKVMGFVHNPGTDPDVLLRLTRLLAGHIGAAADRYPSGKFNGERWLVIVTGDESSRLGTYRHVHSRLAISTGFAKIVMVFGDGRVGILAPDT